MITIKKSPTADTRTCDFSNVDKRQLLDSSIQHIADVRKGLDLIAGMLMEAGARHDYTKLTMIDAFHRDFVTGFKETSWWEEHKKKERHHIAENKHIPEDINLIDVIECIVDGVMAGLARAGQYRHEPIDPDVLALAVRNTADLIIKNTRVDG